jgi:hypothetical protein
VRIKSPPTDCSTAPLQVCSDPPPRNTAPTFGSGGTGAAFATIGAVAGLTAGRCGADGFTAGAGPAHADEHATSSPAASVRCAAMNKRI